MKKISKYYTLLAILIMAGAVFAGISLKSQISGLFSDSEHSEKREYLRQADLGEGKGSGEDEDASERTSWFLKQRLFGLGEIPEKARERAKEQADKIAAPLGDGPLSPAAVWNPVGPQPLDSLFSAAAYGDASGRINWIAVHPTINNIVLLGTATGGIWRSTNALAADGQVVFTPVSDNQVDLAVGSIAFAPSNPNIVYAAMGDRDNAYFGTGILKSTDAGATWTKITTTGLPDKGFSLRIAVKADDPNTLFVVRGKPSNQARNFSGLSFDEGFYRSINGGVTWTKTLDGRVSDAIYRPITTNNPPGDIVYATVVGDGTAGVTPGFYKSNDGGATFTIRTDPRGGLPNFTGATDYRLAAGNFSQNRVYLYGGTGGTEASPPAPSVLADLKLVVVRDIEEIAGQINYTTNNLTLSQIDPAQFHYNTYLVGDPSNNNTLFVGSRDVYKVVINTNGDTIASSTNLTKGFTYNAGTMKYDITELGSKVHADQQQLAFVGTNNAQFFLAHDGGVSRTLDSGATFTKNLNQTLSLDQIIGLSVKPNDSDKIYVGAQDNGTQRRLTGTNWKEFQGGDGGRNRLIAPNFTGLYVNSVKGSFSRFDNVETAVGNGGESVNLVDPAPTGGTHRIAFYPPAESNGTDATLYVGTETLAVCTTCGTTTGSWTYPANNNGQDLTKNTSDHINAMAVQKLADGGVPAIYTGSEEGAFWVRQTGSQTFTDRSAILKAAVGGDRFITSVKMDLNNPSIAYITVSGFGTTNHVLKSTAYGATITRLNFSVDIPVNDFVTDPVTPTTFYIGTDIGIFRSLDSGANWIAFNVGLPPVIVMRLATTNGSGTFTSNPQLDAPAVVTNSITAATYGRGVYQNIIAGPTAAAVSVSGRVTTATGRGITNVRISLTDSNGEVRTATTTSFGYYHFEDVQAGETYIIGARGKHYSFTQPRQVLSVNDEMTNVNFIAYPN
jgi:hypothetical protein